MQQRGHDVTRLVHVALGALAGRELAEIEALGQEMWRTKIAAKVYPDARRLVAGAPAGRAHRRAGLVGDAVPGGRRRGRPRHRAPPGHRDRGRRGHPHRPGARPDPVGAREGRRGRGVRRRAGPGPDRVLRVRQRRGGRAVPRDGRPAAPAQPRRPADRGRRAAWLACAPAGPAAPADPAQRGPLRGVLRRPRCRGRRRPGDGPAQPGPEHGARGGVHGRVGALARRGRGHPGGDRAGEPVAVPARRCSSSTTRASSTWRSLLRCCGGTSPGSPRRSCRRTRPSPRWAGWPTWPTSTAATARRPRPRWPPRWTACAAAPRW